MTCQICNKESGEYSLCPECFDLMQKGEVKQCVNCKNWYKVGSVCNCIKVVPAKKESKPITPNTQAEESEKIAEATNDPAFNNLYLTGKVKYCKNCKTWYKTGTLCKCKPQKAKRFHPAIEVILISLAVILVFLMVTSPITIPVITNIYSERKDDAGQETNFFTILFKDVPEVSVKPDIDLSIDNQWIYLGTDITVKCNANYKKVIIKIDLINHNNAIYKTSYITFEDCEKGQSYQEDYHLSAEEILKTQNIRCELYKYT